jgi:hypothetical protein
MVAYQDGKPVGRIAAIENRAHNQYYKDKVGFFGFLLPTGCLGGLPGCRLFLFC